MKYKVRQKTVYDIKERRSLKKRMAKAQRRNLFSRKRYFPLGVAPAGEPHLKEVCAICGIRDGVTRDHVPPKAIFPKPRPALITVPACRECNNGASDLDDLFKVYLSMHAAENNEIAKKLFHEKTTRTLKRNSRLLSKIKRESRNIGVVDSNGKVSHRTGVLWNSEAHDAVIERTIRGLFFHHYGKPIPSDSKLSVQWLRKIPEEIMPMLHKLKEETIGDGQAVYKYAIYDEDPRHSIWLFEFYGAHWASGHAEPSCP